MLLLYIVCFWSGISIPPVAGVEDAILTSL